MIYGTTDVVQAIVENSTTEQEDAIIAYLDELATVSGTFTTTTSGFVEDVSGVYGTIEEDITTSGTDILYATLSGILTPNGIILIDSEKIEYPDVGTITTIPETTITGTTDSGTPPPDVIEYGDPVTGDYLLDCVRGYDGTSPATHTSGTIFQVLTTSGSDEIGEWSYVETPGDAAAIAQWREDNYADEFRNAILSLDQKYWSSSTVTVSGNDDYDAFTVLEDENAITGIDITMASGTTWSGGTWLQIEYPIQKHINYQRWAAVPASGTGIGGLGHPIVEGPYLYRIYGYYIGYSRDGVGWAYLAATSGVSADDWWNSYIPQEGTYYDNIEDAFNNPIWGYYVSAASGTDTYLTPVVVETPFTERFDAKYCRFGLADVQDIADASGTTYSGYGFTISDLEMMEPTSARGIKDTSVFNTSLADDITVNTIGGAATVTAGYETVGNTTSGTWFTHGTIGSTISLSSTMTEDCRFSSDGPCEVRLRQQEDDGGYSNVDEDEILNPDGGSVVLLTKEDYDAGVDVDTQIQSRVVDDGNPYLNIKYRMVRYNL